MMFLVRCTACHYETIAQYTDFCPKCQSKLEVLSSEFEEK